MNPYLNCILLLYNLNPNLKTAFWLYVIFWAGVIGFGIYLGIIFPLFGPTKKKKGNGSLQSEEYDDGTKGEIEITIKVEKDVTFKN